jgi:hypothetical protein
MRGRDLHLFVDESKAKGYVMAIAIIEAAKLAEARQALRALRLGGQTSLHFKRESVRRRRMILTALVNTGWGGHVVSSKQSRQDVARAECLSLLVGFASAVKARHITLELDASVERFDRQTLFRLLARQSTQESLPYQLVARAHEPGLWAADAIAWSYARGGEWRLRLEALLGEPS